MTSPQLARDTQAPGRLRLVLAEDNTVNQLVLRRVLSRLGYDCHVVSNGLELVEAFTDNEYDVAFVDIQMPLMDGLEAARRLRAAGHARLQLIALTADVTTETRQACVAAGMDQYLSKPITIEAVSTALAAVSARVHPPAPAARTA